MSAIAPFGTDVQGSYEVRIRGGKQVQLSLSLPDSASFDLSLSRSLLLSISHNPCVPLGSRTCGIVTAAGLRRSRLDAVLILIGRGGARAALIVEHAGV
jgi:hypothetical protein